VIPPPSKIEKILPPLFPKKFSPALLPTLNILGKAHDLKSDPDLPFFLGLTEIRPSSISGTG